MHAAASLTKPHYSDHIDTTKMAPVSLIVEPAWLLIASFVLTDSIAVWHLLEYVVPIVASTIFGQCVGPWPLGRWDRKQRLGLRTRTAKSPRGQSFDINA